MTRFIKLALLGLLLGACISLTYGDNKNVNEPHVEVYIPGLVCPSCAIGIKKYLKKELQVRWVKFDAIKELAYINFILIDGRPDYLKPDKIRSLVEKAGYKVKSIKYLHKNTPNRYNKP